MHITRLNELRQAGRVSRWHTTPTIRTQSVSEHSFGVAQLMLYLAPASSAQALSAALWHDLPELVTGDIPSPVKWASHELTHVLSVLEQQFKDQHKLNVDLSHDEWALLEWCDLMDALLWCLEELTMGNNEVTPVIKRAMLKLKDMGFPNRKAEDLYNELSK